VGVGLQDMLVVDTPDAVLVAHVSCAEEMKKVVRELKANNVPQATTHEKEYRPWGCFETIAVTKEYKVKRLKVNPGESLSLQKHQFRSEHWVVVSGVARVTNGKKVFILNENQSTYIPMGAIHRLENPGEVNLEVIEVQLGSYLGDDDIIRLQDFYFRA
jgi:mannose-1-phosphate guanylyltransferase/mannose-6-phosphate isomerase